jgi:hypothetical protein
MSAPNVDLVLVLDASKSMGPCFEGVRQHLTKLLQPLQGYAGTVRFGLLALNSMKRDGQVAYNVVGVNGPCWQEVYAHQPAGLFTSDPTAISSTLSAITPQGNEHTLLALDFALDFPFGPAKQTRRVIALLSDECIEGGVEGSAPCAMIPSLVEKLNQRHVKLFMALPNSPAAEALEAANGCEFESIQGGDGLASLDFSRLFQQMGKSISGTTLQTVAEPPFQKALFGQDKWSETDTNDWNTDD